MDGSPESTAAYDADIAGTKEFFRNVDVHDLPAIFGYWATKYIEPMWRELGVSDTRELFAKYLLESANRCGAKKPVFASVGAGVCVVEVHVAQLLLEYGLKDFVIDCLELSGDLLDIGRASADEASVRKHLNFVEADLNSWVPSRRYDGFMVNHSLHHVVNLEHLFSSIKGAMAPDAYFVVADMIGRNGHMRWPEALVHLHRFWDELPHSYRYNRLLKRHEDLYENWDCSTVAFEGIRAQDILPLLLDRFNFYKFCAFGNVIDVFVDRCFGHNFDPEGAWDRRFIDRVHAFDEAAIMHGELTPTQMLAVLTLGPISGQHFARGLAPQQCVRDPDKCEP